MKPVITKKKFVIYDINIISYKQHDTYNSIFAHCEMETPGEPGGEAFAISVIESSSQLDEEIRIEEKIIFLKEFDKAKLIQFLQAFVDSARPTNWTEVRLHVSKHFDWI